MMWDNRGILRFWNSAMKMGKLRIAFRVLGLAAICVGLLLLWGIHSFERGMDRFASATANDAQDLGIALRGAAGESLFSQGKILPLKTDLGTTPDLISKGKKLLEAYRKDPEKFKKNASMFDTAVNALAVKESLLKMNLPRKTPANSLRIPGVNPSQTFDAWGHPFCFITVQSRIAIVSGGPMASLPFSCDKLRTKKSEMLAFRDIPVRSSSGEVVLMVKLDYPNEDGRHKLD